MVALAAALPACSLLFDPGDARTKQDNFVQEGGTKDGTADGPGAEDGGCPPPQDPPQEGQTDYMSPTGDDANAATREKPLKTFASTIPRLRPGDTLILLDGEYTIASSGALKIDCAPGAPNLATNGTPFD